MAYVIALKTKGRPSVSMYNDLNLLVNDLAKFIATQLTLGTYAIDDLKYIITEVVIPGGGIVDSNPKLHIEHRKINHFYYKRKRQTHPVKMAQILEMLHVSPSDSD